MKKIIYLFVMAMLVSGCATVSLSKIASDNKGNLKKLGVGMSEQEILNIMGTKKVRSAIWNLYTVINNPYRSEIVQTKSGKKLKVLYYFTNARKGVAWEKYSVVEGDLTPLVFEDGKFIGKEFELIE